MLWWILQSVALGEVWLVLKHLTFFEILILILLNTLVFLAFSTCWWILLKAQHVPISFIKVFLYKLAGSGFSFFTPGPQVGGEPLQILFLKKKENLSGSEAIASVGLDKLINVSTKFILILLGSGAMLYLKLFQFSQNPGSVILLITLGSLPLVFLLLLHRGFFPLNVLIRMLRDLGIKVPIKHRWVKLILDSEKNIGQFSRDHLKTILFAFCISLFCWALVVFEFWLSLFFLNVNLNVLEVLSSVAVVRLALYVPVPAGIGAMDAGLVFILKALGYSTSVALAMNIVVRSRDVLFGLAGVLLGFYFLGSVLPGKERKKTSDSFQENGR